MNEQEAQDAARRKVEARLGFFVHLGVFFVVNALLIGIDLATSPEKLWFYWPLMGWGLGLAGHALAVFCSSGLHSLKERWINRAVQKEVERQRSDSK